MSIWAILGIDKTDEALTIKDAYINKLQELIINENIQGFNNLRYAYEEAIGQLDTNRSQIEVWSAKLQHIYMDFEKRINEEEWHNILADEVCSSEEYKDEAYNNIVEFCLENSYLPNNIYKLIDNTFHIESMKKTLYEKFSVEAIEKLINKINNEDTINYNLFEVEKNKDYDKFIEDFNEIYKLVKENKYEEVSYKLALIKELGIIHPYLIIIEMEYLIEIGQVFIAREASNLLVGKYEEDMKVAYALAKLEYIDKNFSQALNYYKKILELNSNEYEAKIGKGDCYFKLEKYELAREVYKDILKEDIYNDYVKNNLYIATEEIIKILNIDIITDPCDDDKRYILARCLFENLRYKEALEVASEIEDEKERVDERLELLGQIYYKLGKYANSLDIYNKWLKITEDEEDTEFKNERLADIYCSIGNVLNKLDRLDESIDSFIKGIEFSEKKYENLNSYASVLVQRGDFEEAINVSKRSLELNDSKVETYTILANALFNIGEFSQSLDKCSIAIDIYPFSREAYTIKLGIYRELEKYDDILNIIDQMEKINIVTNIDSLFKIEALIGKDLYEEAELLCNELIVILEEEKNMCNEAITEIYYLLAKIEFKKNNNENSYLNINRAIKKNPDEIKYYYYRINLYREEKRLREAIVDCNSILGKDSNNKNINGLISELYDEQGEKAKSLEYLSVQISVNPTVEHLIRRAEIYRNENKFKEAVSDYQKAIEIDSDSSSVHNDLGRFYFENFYYKKSMEYYIKSVELNNDSKYSEPYCNLAEVYIKLEKFEDAFKLYDKAVEEIDDKILILMNKANLYIKLDQYSEAIKVCENIIDINNTIEDPYMLLLKIYNNLEQYENSIKVIERFSEISQENKDPLLIAKNIVLSIEDVDLAKKFNDNVLKVINKKYKKSILSITKYIK